MTNILISQRMEFLTYLDYNHNLLYTHTLI